jgi:hypothetical protein
MTYKELIYNAKQTAKTQKCNNQCLFYMTILNNGTNCKLGIQKTIANNERYVIYIHSSIFNEDTFI